MSLAFAISFPVIVLLLAMLREHVERTPGTQ
jgi:hypothetical protein